MNIGKAFLKAIFYQDFWVMWLFGIGLCHFVSVVGQEYGISLLNDYMGFGEIFVITYLWKVKELESVKG